MAGFRKAKAEQAAVKMGIYGAAGSGKTFTALLFAEGIAKLTGRRIAFVDTDNRGTDFYAMNVPERRLHPEAFDFDALYTKEVTETIEAVRGIDPAEHAVVIIDSITHIWRACQAAYAGKMTKIGTIPFTAWAEIKRPYNELINLLLNGPLHVFICGRQGNEFEEDQETGELKRVGYKMKSEGETPYEPHFLLRLEAVKNPKEKLATITAFAEKDRSGLLAGQTIAWPNFDNVIKPILPLLGSLQGKIASDEDAAKGDAVRLTEQQAKKQDESAEIAKTFKARISLCDSKAKLDALGKEITPELKKKMTTADLNDIRQAFLDAQKEVKA